MFYIKNKSHKMHLLISQLILNVIHKAVTVRFYFHFTLIEFLELEHKWHTFDAKCVLNV